MENSRTEHTRYRPIQREAKNNPSAEKYANCGTRIDEFELFARELLEYDTQYNHPLPKWTQKSQFGGGDDIRFLRSLYEFSDLVMRVGPHNTNQIA